MRATNWEFKNRALVFGLIFGISFVFYFVDSQNAVAALANWIEGARQIDATWIARLLFVIAAGLVAEAAFIRTWASSYLDGNVVYASNVKTESLVADGPYRHLRNPLYFANVLLAIGLGAMMSRIGFFLAVSAMLVFCYRLIFREESELELSRGDPYRQYKSAVPRLIPTLRSRITSAGRQANWLAGFKAEFWCWGCATSVVAFAVSLNVKIFFAILAVSLAVFWFSSTLLQRTR